MGVDGATFCDATSTVRGFGGAAAVPLVDLARPEGAPDRGVPQDHRGQVPIAPRLSDLAFAAWWSRGGRCSQS